MIVYKTFSILFNLLNYFIFLLSVLGECPYVTMNSDFFNREKQGAANARVKYTRSEIYEQFKWRMVSYEVEFECTHRSCETRGTETKYEAVVMLPGKYTARTTMKGLY